ncbi:hypothetical protein [Gracilimonas sp. BCB1]|uniref:hypothetical protein n=1 Tax=Gracilimonas sp. BCB1 TaxID=3152362 RepID=UPI003F83CA24
MDTGSSPNSMEEMESPYNLIAVTGETSYTDVTPPPKKVIGILLLLLAETT